MMLAPCSARRAPPRLAPLPEYRYEKSFSRGLFVKNIFRKVKIKKLHAIPSRCMASGGLGLGAVKFS
jgi:hypothetical protein